MPFQQPQARSLVPLHRRRRQLACHRAGRHHPGPHRRRRAADQPAALGRDRRRRHRLRGVAGLPVPLRLRRQRHRHEQVDQRDHLGRRSPASRSTPPPAPWTTSSPASGWTAAPPAHRPLGLTYYFYPNRSCTAATCQLAVGFISSTNGGASWSTADPAGRADDPVWVANTSQGRMVGDYISTSVRTGATRSRLLRSLPRQRRHSSTRRCTCPPAAYRSPAAPAEHSPARCGTKRHRPPGCPRIWVAPPRPLTAT